MRRFAMFLGVVLSLCLFIVEEIEGIWGEERTGTNEKEKKRINAVMVC